MINNWLIKWTLFEGLGFRAPFFMFCIKSFFFVYICILKNDYPH